MKALSRLASPAGFALVLLLFLFLPFLSVSCDVPGMGKLGADYTGGQLAVGAEPEVEVPQGLQDMAEDLPGGGGDESEPPPDPGVQVLAIVTALLIAAGIATAVIPRVRHRLFGAAGIAVLAGVLAVVTQLVAQSNLTAQLEDEAGEMPDSGSGSMTPEFDAVAEEMIHTEIGYWLTLVGLGLIAVLSVGAVFKDKILPRSPAAAGGPPPGAPGYGTPPQGYGQPPGGQPQPGHAPPHGGPFQQGGPGGYDGPDHPSATSPERPGEQPPGAPPAGS